MDFPWTAHQVNLFIHSAGKASRNVVHWHRHRGPYSPDDLEEATWVVLHHKLSKRYVAHRYGIPMDVLFESIMAAKEAKVERQKKAEQDETDDQDDETEQDETA